MTARSPARPEARAGRSDAPARPALRRRPADTRTSVATQARTVRRTTWAAQDNYLLVLSTTRISCQRPFSRVAVHWGINWPWTTSP
eukprot:2507589-Prymnesium_polylepis.1